ncbi:unnamed protein product [Diamesa hyperborea]
MNKLQLLILVGAVVFSVDLNSANAVCLETSKPHQTECTKYFKCIVLPNQITSWISMECPEGLIYDDNLKSCAIPGEDWDCVLSDENSMDSERDENNVYGIDNLEVTDESDDFKTYELDEKQPDNDDDEFIEVINGAGDITSPPDSVDDNFDSEDGFSGNGSIPDDIVTPTTPSSRMITTHLQRLNQLVKHVQERQDNIKRNDADVDLTADDLNSFLSNQKIHDESPEYQKIDFNSNDKTPMPHNGKIHPEILSEILNKQNKLVAHTTFATTLSMDATTAPPTVKNGIYYEQDEPQTEIQLTNGKNPQGYSNHQIVVNRPEGSVLFNVPAQYDQTKPVPYLSEDILKTVLELSKQMVANRQQPQPTYSPPPQPIYYAIPYPVISPQNNVQNYYTNQVKPNSTRSKQTQPGKNKPQVQLTSVDKKKPAAPVVTSAENTYSQGYIDSYGIFHTSKPQQQQQPSYLNFQQQQQLSSVNPTANYYYQNYPASSYNQQSEQLADDTNQNQNQYQNPSSYQSNYQNFPPINYQYHANNQYPNYNQLAFDGNYNGNRPFVIESSAPSYLEQHGIRATKKPFKKESYSSSPYDADDEDEYETNVEEENDNGNEENLSDYLENSNGDEPQQDELPEPQRKPVEVVEELICSLGTRQANITSCLKYYVCNPMTKEVLSYTCPSFTAFNDRTRICDVASYETCQVKEQKKNYSYNENQKMFQQAFKALEQAKRESQRAEKIASLVRKESQKIMNNRRYPQQVQNAPSPVTQSSRPIRIKNIKPTRTNTKRNKPKQSGITKRKKKGQLCPDVGKVADPDSNNFYYHCFREQKSGKMKRMKLQCNGNLIFCPATKYCTSVDRC